MDLNKRQIIKKCENDLTREQNQTILQLLIELKVTVNECSDGSYINLDRLPTDQITALKHKIDSIDKIPVKYKMWNDLQKKILIILILKTRNFGVKMALLYTGEEILTYWIPVLKEKGTKTP